jgi:hypothetical protein
MSEVTTGAVGLNLIGAPIAVGVACANAVAYTAKFCNEKYKDMLKDIQATDEKLKWLNAQQFSSPIQLETEAKRLQGMVINNPLFNTMTTGLTIPQKEILAITIATENSPLKSFIPDYLSQMEVGKSSMEDALQNSVKDLAMHNFNKVTDVVSAAAKATGFNINAQVITKSKNVLDIVFTDVENRKFTAFIKLNKELNPSLALDLEGFACDANTCTLKMDEIIKYLNDHGIPFEYKKLKHNQPSGVLRKLLQKKNTPTNGTVADYLTSTNQDYLTNNKIK